MTLIEVREISVHINPGTSISQAAMRAISLANRFNCVVKFDFNEIPFEVKPHHTVQGLNDRYFRKCKERGRDNAN